MARVQDKVAIITGAGQEIGLGDAARFLEEGAKVVVADIDDERAQHALAELGGDAVASIGAVDILVNNAALSYDIDNFDPSDEARVVTGQVLVVDGGLAMPA